MEHCINTMCARKTEALEYASCIQEEYFCHVQSVYIYAKK